MRLSATVPLLVAVLVTATAAVPAGRAAAQQTTVSASGVATRGPAPAHGVRPRRLVIRGAMVIEGNGTPRNVVLEFPSYEHALGYAKSTEYAEAKALREGAGTIDITVVEGV